MTQRPERDRPPKLVPGEPLWGTPSISGADAPAESRSPSRPHHQHAPRATGTARAVSPAVTPAPPAPPPPGPVRFGETPAASDPPQAPPGSGYGQGITYGQGKGHGHGGVPGQPRGHGQTGGYRQPAARSWPGATPDSHGTGPDDRGTGKAPTSVLAVTAAVFFLLGAVAGFGAAWLVL